jgi:hypothetical protein
LTYIMGTEAESLIGFADGVWLDTGAVRIVGMPLTSTMVVLRLAGGELLVYSPVALTPARRAAVDALGPVAHLYAPNLFHHRWMSEWTAAYPAARLHAPPGLAKKRPDLRIDRIHGRSAEPGFSGSIDEIPIDGFRLRETALVYRPARTLVVADLLHNVGRPSHPWSATYTRAMGFYDRAALSRVIRWTGFDNRPAARRSIEALLAHPFDRIVVGHGAPVTVSAHETFALAYGWLTRQATRGGSAEPLPERESS